MFNENNESVTNVLTKDVKKTFKKFLYIFTKSCYDSSAQELVKWDFVGPFLITVLFSLTVYHPWREGGSEGVDKGFVLFFLTLWFGPLVCGINASYLGCYVHFFSIVSVMMYLLLPLCLASFVSLFFPFAFRSLFILPSYLYISVVSYRFIRNQSVDTKHFLSYQPVWLFYTIYTMLAILN